MAEGAALQLFRYRAREPGSGRLLRGERHGPDAYAVRSALRELGLLVEDVAPVATGRRLPAPLSGIERAWWARQRRRRRFARADLCDAIATMLDAGVPLEAALATAAKAPSRARAERRMLSAVVEALRAGETLHAACTRHPDWFDAFDLAMLRAGQHAGALPATLRALAEHHVQAGALAHKLFTALAYPTVLLLAAIGVSVFLSTVTLPQLVALIEGAGKEVPWLTAMLMRFGEAILHWWWAGLLGIGLAAVLLARLPVPAWLRRGPIARARRRTRLAQVSAVLARLLRSGVPLVEALGTAAELTRSAPLQALLLEAQRGVREGRDLSAVMGSNALVEDEFAQLLQLGEQAGELPAVLERLAERYERAARQSLERLTALLEPAAILLMAALIGVVVFAAVQPLLEMGRLW